MKSRVIDIWTSFFSTPACDSRIDIGILNEAEALRASRLRKPLDAMRWRHARANLRAVLGHYLNCDPRLVVFEHDTYEKPFLAGTPLHFNLSHSEDVMLLAVSREIPVGVDVEYAKALPDLAKVANRFFERTEAAALLAMPTNEQLPAFYRCWTRKEAILKAVGTGLSTPLDAFTVSFVKGACPTMQWRDHWTGPRDRMQLVALDPGDGYIGALACLEEAPCELRWYDPRTLSSRTETP